MKWSTVAVGLTVFGLIGISIILLFQQLTTTNENDYYLLKEITEAAMVDAIDISYYRETGELKIVREKFVDSFTRRFAESTLIIGTKYTIKFFDIIEEPPKVSVRIDTGIENYKIYNTSGDYNVVNELTGILEYVPKAKTSNNTQTPTIKGKKDQYIDTSDSNIDATLTTKDFHYYAIIKNDDKCDRIINKECYKELTLNIPDELISGKYKNQIMNSITYKKMDEVTQAIVNKAVLKRDIDYIGRENEDYGNNNKFYLPLENVTQIVYNRDSIGYLCGTNNTDSDISCESTLDTSTNKNINKVKIHKSITENEKDYAIIHFIVKWQYNEYEYEYVS